MSKNVSRFFLPLRKRTHGAKRGQDKSRSVLVLRLENTEVLGAALDRGAMGHLLVQLSMTLGAGVRTYDPMQIIAPGLFAFILRNRTERDALQVARRLHRQGQTPVPVSGQFITPVMTGILIHSNAPDLPSFPALIENACRRMDLVGNAFLGLLKLYPHDPELGSSGLITTVSDAVTSGQMVAWFQPQVCCETGQITGFEALARWGHPTRGLMPPSSFIPKMSAADQNTLTLFMLAQSMTALKTWDHAGFNVPTVSINISHCELSDRGFADCLLWELDRHNIPPRRLVIEVLENVGPVSSSAATRDNLRKLANAGCRIDLDDFGTGYASLDAIRQFGINRIKIDRSFVIGCDIDSSQQRMILAILALAERLEISALAEGVETREEYAFLAQMGCAEVQGYAIARPMPLHETLPFLTQHTAAYSELPTLARRV